MPWNSMCKPCVRYGPGSFGLPSTIRTCDLRLRRNRGWSKNQQIQWLKSKILNCATNCAMGLGLLEP